MKKIIGITLILSALMAACGPTAAPTMDPLNVQNTAVAAAWTVVALTQAAIPTATPIPPTDIPSPTAFPTFTPLPLPTLEIPTQSSFNPGTVAGGPTSDPCNQPMAADAAGHKVTVHFVNKSNGSVVMSLYMTQKSLFGECGYYSFSFGKSDSPVVDILQGCYWAGAFVTGKQASKAFGNFCVTDTSHKYDVLITSEFIGFLNN